MSYKPTEAEVIALARVLAPASRKLRHGSQHPNRPSEPNSLGRRVAFELLTHQAVSLDLAPSPSSHQPDPTEDA